MRERNSADRRVVNVVICEKGRERLADIYRDLCDNLFDWTRTLSQEDMTAFNAALETSSACCASSRMNEPKRPSQRQ